MVIYMQSLCMNMCICFPCVNTQECEQLSHMAGWSFEETAKLFSKIIVPSRSNESSRCSVSSRLLDMISVVNFNHSNWCIMLVHWGFSLHSLMINDVQHFFMYPFPIHICSLVRYLFKSLPHILLFCWGEVICLLHFERCYRYQVHYQMQDLQILSHSLWLEFSFW